MDEIFNQEGFHGEWINEHKYWTNSAINLRIEFFNGLLKFYHPTSKQILFLYEECKFIKNQVLNESNLLAILKEAKEKKLLIDIKRDFK